MASTWSSIFQILRVLIRFPPDDTINSFIPAEHHHGGALGNRRLSDVLIHDTTAKDLFRFTLYLLT